eukprot:364163-Chlamydomonas_euryale.AAC.7
MKGCASGVGASVESWSRPSTVMSAVRSMNCEGLLMGTLPAVAPGSTYATPTVTVVMMPEAPLAVLYNWDGATAAGVELTPRSEPPTGPLKLCGSAASKTGALPSAPPMLPLLEAAPPDGPPKEANKADSADAASPQLQACECGGMGVKQTQLCTYAPLTLHLRESGHVNPPAWAEAHGSTTCSWRETVAVSLPMTEVAEYVTTWGDPAGVTCSSQAEGRNRMCDLGLAPIFAGLHQGVPTDAKATLLRHCTA